MRPVFLASLLGCLVAGLAGFVFGRIEGEREAGLAYRSISANLDAQTSAASFLAATRAVDLLNGGESGRAKGVLLQFAQLQAPNLRTCGRSQSCAAWVGSLLPSAERLSSVESEKVSEPSK